MWLCVSVTLRYVTFVTLRLLRYVKKNFLSKRPSSFCLIHFGGISGAARGQLGDSSGAAQGLKPTFDGRRPLMEDDL